MAVAASAAKAAEDRPIAAATTRANTFFILISSKMVSSFQPHCGAVEITICLSFRAFRECLVSACNHMYNAKRTGITRRSRPRRAGLQITRRSDARGNSGLFRSSPVACLISCEVVKRLPCCQIFCRSQSNRALEIAARRYACARSGSARSGGMPLTVRRTSPPAYRTGNSRNRRRSSEYPAYSRRDSCRWSKYPASVCIFSSHRAGISSTSISPSISARSIS